MIHRPPDWKVPTLVIGTVIAVVLAAFAIALINLSTDASQATHARAGQTVTITTTVRSPRGAVPSRAAIEGWPIGLAGWTVALSQSHSKARAYATARRLAAAGTRTGVLSSSRHPSMIPGYWIVFSGRYPTRVTATAAAAKLGAQGYLTQAIEVAPPGGI